MLEGLESKEKDRSFSQRFEKRIMKRKEVRLKRYTSTSEWLSELQNETEAKGRVVLPEMRIKVGEVNPLGNLPHW